MRLPLVWLLLLSCLFLAGLVLAGMMMLRLHKQGQRQKMRIFSVTEPHLRTGADASSTLVRLTTSLPTATLVRRFFLLFGYDQVLRSRYRMAWPVVLLGSGVLAAGMPFAARMVVGQLGWFGAPVLWAFASRSYYKRCDARHAQTLYKQFPDALATIVRSVRVGVPVSEAVRVVAREALEPTATEFSRLGDQITIGVPLDEALKDMATRNKLPEYRFFATALSLQSQTGGGLTDTLENLATTIRKRVQAKAKGNALASEAKTSTYILAALPIVMGFLIYLVNPAYIGVLFTDEGGHKLLFLAAGMLGLGFYAMRTIIRKSLT